MLLYLSATQPLSRFFHAAALIKDTMVIVGGRTEVEDYSNLVSLYQINCNTWIQPGDHHNVFLQIQLLSNHNLPNHNLTFIHFFLSVSAVGDPVNQSVSLAMTSWGGNLYLSGGFNGVTLGRLLTLSVPSDPCALLATPEACNTTTGSCVWCRGTCASSDTAER